MQCLTESPVCVPVSVVQAWLLQLWLCRVMPSQSRPPFLGGGAEQLLFLRLTPPPHWASHSDHSVHPDQWPSTTRGHRRAWDWGNHCLWKMPCAQHQVQRTDLDMLEGNTLDCRTGPHRRPLQAEPPSVCPSAGTRSPDHRTRYRRSRLSTGTWCSPLEERKRLVKNQIWIFSCLITNSEVES